LRVFIERDTNSSDLLHYIYFPCKKYYMEK
jgi:hypothetical protein